MKKKNLNLPIEFFVENDIFKYSGDKDSTIKEMLDKFLENSFFILLDKNGKIEGYLDYFDTTKLKEFFEKEIKENKNLLMLKIFDCLDKIPFRKEDIYNKNAPTFEVIDSMKKKKNLFIPIINNQNHFVGKVSINLIAEKLDKLGEAGFSI